MPKKTKKEKHQEWLDKLLEKKKKDRQLIKALLKVEIPILKIASHLGLSVKTVKYLIARWNMHEKLLIPRLREG